VLTRTPGRASSMPEGESLTNFAKTGATLAIHLSVQNLARVVADLTPDYGSECPVAVVYRASWPDEQIVRGTLGDIETQLGDDIKRTALIVVGPALAGEGFDESCVYAVDYDRRYRPQSADSPWSNWTPEGE
jgi:precorrin-4/cobalt-precorrin-4 C11-methyltransferase